MLKHKPVYYTDHPNPNISFTLTFYLSSILKSVIIPHFILKCSDSHNLTSQNSQNIKTVFSVIKTKEIKLIGNMFFLYKKRGSPQWRLCGECCFHWLRWFLLILGFFTLCVATDLATSVTCHTWLHQFDSYKRFWTFLVDEKERKNPRIHETLLIGITEVNAGKSLWDSLNKGLHMKQ